MTSGDDIRIGDAERDAAANDLREHFASGRLTQDELNERLDRTFAARTRSDLNGLFTDLPTSTRPGTTASGALGRPGQQRGGWDASNGGRTPFGSDDPYADAGSADGSGQGAYGRRTLGSVLVPLVALSALFAFGLFSVFGLGGPRPFGFVLFLAAFALLRRLILVIFGRRRGGRGGPRRRGGGCSRRRRR